MLSIELKVTGKPIQEFITDLDNMLEQINNELIQVSKATVNWMQTVIATKTSRSTAPHWDTVPLGDAIERSSEVTVLPDGVFIGIGNIDEMNYSSKHWAFINYGHTRTGFTIPGGGKFVPGYWEGDKFIYEPGCGTGMVVKTPIFGLHSGQPMNYIEEGQNFMDKQIKDIISRAKSRMEK